VDLCNTHPGDGRSFKGRGRIQITGRYNYAAYGRDAALDLTKPRADRTRHPLAEAPERDIDLILHQLQHVDRYARLGGIAPSQFQTTR